MTHLAITLVLVLAFGYLVYRQVLTNPRLSEAGKTGVMILLLIGMFVGFALSLAFVRMLDGRPFGP